MSKLKALQTMISRTAGRGGLIVQKNSPEILVAVGVLGIITSAVLACRATLKVEEVLDKAKDKIDKINNLPEDIKSGKVKLQNEGDEYTEKDAAKDLIMARVQTGLDFAKLYGPSVLIGAVSIGCILGGHNILKKRNIGLMAAYKAVEKSFAQYRSRVVEEFGAEKDYKLKNGIREIEITDLGYTDENGVVHPAETKIVEVKDPNGYSQYAKFFDETCLEWTKTPEYNLMFLKNTQNHANDLLHSRGHVFLNEVYDMLGIKRTQAGAVVGWVDGVCDNFIDFGIFDGEKEKARDFVNGHERSILLDFNVAGVIYEMI